MYERSIELVDKDNSILKRFMYSDEELILILNEYIDDVNASVIMLSHYVCACGDSKLSITVRSCVSNNGSYSVDARFINVNAIDYYASEHDWLAYRKECYRIKRMLKRHYSNITVTSFMKFKY